MNRSLSISPIQPDDPWGELLRMTSILICDKATMGNKAVFDCVEETCHKVMRNDLLFGGKIFKFLGDFQQTCSVVWGGSKAQVIAASIKSCSFWPQLRLIHYRWNAKDPEFAQFDNDIGDGAEPEVSLDMLHHVSRAEEVIDFVYPTHILQHPHACLRWSILAPTNWQEDEYNNTILDCVQGDWYEYMVVDSLKEATTVGLTSPASALDFVGKQTSPGLPSRTLAIKINGIY